MPSSNRNLTIYKALCVLLSVIVVCCLYLLNEEVGLINLYDKYLRSSSLADSKTISSEKEFRFLSSFLEKYYAIDRSVSVDEKNKFISDFFSENMVANLSKQQALAIPHFHRLNGSQKSQIEKIIFSKPDRSYIILLNVHQIIPEQNPSTLLVQLKVQLETRDNSFFKIASWDEKILSVPPTLLTSKDLQSDANIISIVNFPCKINSVSPLNDRNEVELKLSANSQTVIFHTQKRPQGNSIFRAVCNQRHFLLNVSYNPEMVTIYQDLKLADGELIQMQKALSRQEKINLGIKQQLKDWGIEATN